MKRLFKNVGGMLRSPMAFVVGGSFMLLMFVLILPSCSSKNNMDDQECSLTFLGVPVDGSEEGVASALEKKGFIRDKDNFLVGKLYGDLCTVSILTHNGQVNSIGVWPVRPQSEEYARAQYNTIVRQFLNDPRYMSTTKWPSFFNTSGPSSDRSALSIAYFYDVEYCPIDYDKRFVYVVLVKQGKDLCGYMVNYCNGNNYPPKRYDIKVVVD